MYVYEDAEGERNGRISHGRELVRAWLGLKIE